MHVGDDTVVTTLLLTKTRMILHDSDTRTIMCDSNTQTIMQETLTITNLLNFYDTRTKKIKNANERFYTT